MLVFYNETRVIMKKKLTLTVQEEIIKYAKRTTAERGIIRLADV